MIVQLSEPEKAAHLFEGWQETMIWSCLQHVMGAIYIPEGNDGSALALLADFGFLAGEVNDELTAQALRLSGQKFLILVPQNDQWAASIQRVYGHQAKLRTRWAIQKEPERLNRERLSALAKALPAGYELRRMDRELYHRCLGQDWSRDFVSNYKSWEEFQQLGLGVIALKEGELCAGASSYTSYRQGIEIEVDTRPDCRRKGLATACCARLILDCLERGLYPSWDAHNLMSVGLAEKLGYRVCHEYKVYEVSED
ncbi:MAG: GNAT family N-acetyltransferase [Oscillospiraceae bacterium]|nr:GNAT family N-acetyltransferase [Oscillospiraceae bacterium]